MPTITHLKAHFADIMRRCRHEGNGLNITNDNRVRLLGFVVRADAHPIFRTVSAITVGTKAISGSV